MHTDKVNLIIFKLSKRTSEVISDDKLYSILYGVDLVKSLKWVFQIYLIKMNKGIQSCSQKKDMILQQ